MLLGKPEGYVTRSARNGLPHKLSIYIRIRCESSHFARETRARR